jgi:flavodoxin
MNIRRLKIIKSIFLRLSVSLLLAAFIQIPPIAFSEEHDAAQTLIIYYSRSGKTKLISETLAKNIGADILEIKDPQDRAGWWGFMISGLDAFRHLHTPIEPEKPNTATYSTIIVATPIWSWNVSTPIHTLFEKNSFDGKKLILLTTANIHIMKYEKFGDDAPFIKRYLKGYFETSGKLLKPKSSIQKEIL